LPCEVIDEAIIVPVRHVIQILHADYLRNGLCLRQLLATDITQSEITNQSLIFQFSQHRQRFFNRSLRRPHNSSNPKIDDIQPVESEIP